MLPLYRYKYIILVKPSPLILCLDGSLRSLEDAPISDFSDEIFPYAVGEKDIIDVMFNLLLVKNLYISQLIPPQSSSD